MRKLLECYIDSCCARGLRRQQLRYAVRSERENRIVSKESEHGSCLVCFRIFLGIN